MFFAAEVDPPPSFLPALVDQPPSFLPAQVDQPPSFKQMLLRLTQVLTNRLVNQIALLKVMYTLNMKQGNRPFSI